MAANPHELRVLADEARALARRELGQATLYSVLVDLPEGEWSHRPRRVRFGFQALKRSLLSGPELRACWVEVRPEPTSSRIVSTGTFGRRQFRELAARRGHEFPPPALDLTRIRLEVPDVVAMLRRTSPLGAAMGRLDLSVCVCEGRLAWRALQEVPAVGFRTLLVDAGDGSVLHEHVDWWREGRAARGE
jgi:hypothetical protein